MNMNAQKTNRQFAWKGGIVWIGAELDEQDGVSGHGYNPYFM